MNIAIIGAGFTGLTAAYRLSKLGHRVTVFEKELKPGGLAIGYKEKDWEWTLEEHYHHWFTNDSHVLNLAKEIGYETIVRRPLTSVFVENHIYQFDSPVSILLFPKLSLADRIRMAATVGALRLDPFWKQLEGINASKFLPQIMGHEAYKMIWEPLFINKFGKFADQVSLAWFWARITKRTPSLAYPKGGFLKFAEGLTEKIIDLGGEINFNSEIITLKKEKRVVLRIREKGQEKTYSEFDKAIITLPSFLFTKIAPQLPASYKESLNKLKGLGATNLVLRLNKQFFPDKTYWLSICDTSSPVMAIVEHTNFMDKRHYNNEHIVYLGNYLPADSPNFLKSKNELLSLYDPYLKKINPGYKKQLIDYKVFKAAFAQPIIPPFYSRMIPSHTTPLPQVYLANIEQVYPWDRGTNYAVELGQKVALMAAK
jgi:protoporphyrinogen oxidase